MCLLASLFVWATSPRGIWAAEKKVGFPLAVPRTPPPGLGLTRVTLVPKTGRGASHVADLAYAGSGQAVLHIFESPLPLGPDSLKATAGPVIMEETVRGTLVLDGYERVGGLYVEAEGQGLKEPAFVAALDSLRSVDGGLAYVLFGDFVR